MPTGTGSRCCGSRKRCSGTVIIVFATIATIAMTIVAIAASAVPLYSAFGWINVILNVTVLVTASIFVCRCRDNCGDECCGDERCLQLVRGIMVVYCVLAIISIIVCASGTDAAVRHNCEGKVKCDSAVPFAQLYFWNRECGQKTSRFQLCTGPETGGGHLYYSKWGDDCHLGDKHCRAFATERDCWNYCNPYSSHDDDQCENVGRAREGCKKGESIYDHVNGLATWSSIAILLLLVPSVIWAFCLFRPDQPKSTDPPTAADVALAVAAPPVATPEIEIEMGEAPRAKFDTQTGKPIPKFDPQTGKQNW